MCGACPLPTGIQNFLSESLNYPCNCILSSSAPIPTMSSGLYEELGIRKDASPEQGMSSLSLQNIAHGQPRQSAELTRRRHWRLILTGYLLEQHRTRKQLQKTNSARYITSMRCVISLTNLQRLTMPTKS